MFARPFGYELNLSSSDRESPERGRMSQILMKTERDLGAMISFEPRRKDHPLRYIKWDIGLFNGQGLTATTDYDSHKDLISRLSLKPYPVNNKTTVSLGISYLNGGWLQKNSARYTLQKINTSQYDFVKSSDNFSNTIAPRKYYGADFQLKHTTKAGYTEFRAEYWKGTQSAGLDFSETPAILLTEPVYERKFAGGFLYFLTNIGNKQNQVGIKYDWYDPNTSIKGTEIGDGNTVSAANIAYTTLGFGYIHHFTENLKSVVWYENVKNEKTNLAGYQNDIADNMLTIRLQYRF